MYHLPDNKIYKSYPTVLTDEIRKDLYCFDLYGFSILSLNSDFILNKNNFLDIQSLYGIQYSKRIDKLDELFDKDKYYKYFELKERINAHLKSYSICKINIKNKNLQELIPRWLFDDFYLEKLKCLKDLQLSFNEEVIKYYKDNYQKIISTVELSKRQLYFDKKLVSNKFYIFGNKNSRFSIRKNEVNIYSIPKENRHLLEVPENYTLVQFDFKSFQPRLALAIFGDEKIKTELSQTEDLYSIFEGNREDIKLELISWLFSNRSNEKFDSKLECIKKARKELNEKAKTGKILNYFNRPLFFKNEEENVVFQHYISSVEADVILNLIGDVQDVLSGCKSYLILPFYDSLIFSIYNEEKHKINELKEYLETYLLDKTKLTFPVHIKEGQL